LASQSKFSFLFLLAQTSCFMPAFPSVAALGPMLSQGQMVLLPSTYGWLLLADSRQETLLSTLFTHINASIKNPYTLFFAEAGLMANYAEGIADVAWDIIEYEEKALRVFFQKVKNLPLLPESPVALSLVKEGLLQQLLHRFGRPLLGIEVPGNQAKDLPAALLPLIAPDCLQAQPLPPRQKSVLMRLGPLGEVEIWK
jgi:hypothetical protein